MSQKTHTRINEAIRAREVRVIAENGDNLGVITTKEAIQKAQEVGLDLIEISPNSNPPIAKIMDYGKFQYEQNKKAKVAKAKAHVTETKVIQIKIGTSEHDLNLKAKNISKWLKEGNRIKLDLFLMGRTKYMDMQFLKGRLERILNLITEEYKVADEPKKGPKGLTMTLERK
ncbi:translation initiation factor IF-3 [Candidatus Campbellbacteria bacterium RIFCSPLOWO2_01_FULL_34_15]|jgi:translation initiation factor IF-3|uniref:Translation initiation factor IF-3 n=2 Tax=Candidatus Campbelliibacteriota TaxID=1752727 RepID=A0A1F5ENZ8_9BACT|nr:MAG: translation initiation factor IF-3, translation initiation factor IF-3 [Candidatus Campbellbacteria bacterium GW2011_OD1_34_28]KKP74522.1 MAG: Translation initiation factor IF-3 [Candidatus Campbellbacteria bacterium GW2011_GWD2_35_24]KKP76521.1 MAG: Translation initiation factor IF-3 [Candidatus Campbellbacteria bacterium GW2011_GWC1_35_31]KKP78560.1 MAG: Translation initiation factor IF-3 [Candidatus Campbellbacteria bacterium GW2011_GWD1_35_49]OGD68659.1 MAG: translation initiation f